VRAKAVDFIKRAKDYAHAIGVDRVTCCPLSDGYDYAFHTHYVRAWERMVDCVKEAAAHRPEITLFMEYKPSETRSTVSSTRPPRPSCCATRSARTSA